MNWWRTLRMIPWLVCIAIGGAQLLGTPYPVFTGIVSILFGLCGAWIDVMSDRVRMDPDELLGKCRELERALEENRRLMEISVEASAALLQDVEALKQELDRALADRMVEACARIEAERKLEALTAARTTSTPRQMHKETVR